MHKAALAVMPLIALHTRRLSDTQVTGVRTQDGVRGSEPGFVSSCRRVGVHVAVGGPGASGSRMAKRWRASGKVGLHDERVGIAQFWLWNTK